MTVGGGVEDAGFRMVEGADWSSLAALCAEYCWRVDNGHSNRIPDLFTEDGIWHAPGRSMSGGDALRAGWDAHWERSRTRFSRHMVGTMRFTWDGEAAARGVVGFTVYSGPPGEVNPPVPLLVGEHHDRYRRDRSGRWLFSARTVVPLFPSDWVPA